jgi:hypothetical protein
MTEATWTRVRDLAGSEHPSPADAIRLIDAGLLAGERRDDGHVWVNEADLTAAHEAHGARLRAEEVAQLAAERKNREPVTPRRYPGA